MTEELILHLTSDKIPEQRVTRDDNDQIHFYKEDKELWICPYMRFWGWSLGAFGCQLEYDLGKDVPFWVTSNSMINPRYAKAKCKCSKAPSEWGECSVALNIIEVEE